MIEEETPVSMAWSILSEAIANSPEKTRFTLEKKNSDYELKLYREMGIIYVELVPADKLIQEAEYVSVLLKGGVL